MPRSRLQRVPDRALILISTTARSPTAAVVIRGAGRSARRCARVVGLLGLPRRRRPRQPPSVDVGGAQPTPAPTSNWRYPDRRSALGSNDPGQRKGVARWPEPAVPQAMDVRGHPTDSAPVHWALCDGSGLTADQEPTAQPRQELRESPQGTSEAARASLRRQKAGTRFRRAACAPHVWGDAGKAAPGGR